MHCSPMYICYASVQVRILSSLDHPSIIHYYGTAAQNNVHYIVTGLSNMKPLKLSLEQLDILSCPTTVHTKCL